MNSNSEGETISLATEQKSCSSKKNALKIPAKIAGTEPGAILYDYETERKSYAERSANID